jgi:hypothetical protein
MEPRGLQRWQPAANRPGPDSAKTSMVRRGLRFESGRGLCKSAARRRFSVQTELLHWLLLHPWIVRGVRVHGRAAVIDGFRAQFVVPGFVAVDLA